MFLIKIIIVLLMTGWVYARVKQNGYSINKITKANFMIDMIIEGPIFCGAIFLLGYSLLVAIIINPIEFLQIVSLLLLTVTGMVTIVITIIWTINKLLKKFENPFTKIAPLLMRKTNGMK